MDAPIEIASVVIKVKYQKPVTRHVAMLTIRVRPTPNPPTIRPSSVGHSKKNSKNHTPSAPRRCEMPGDIHERWSANRDRTAVIAHAIVKIVA